MLPLRLSLWYTIWEEIWEASNTHYLEARKSEKITNNMGKIVLGGTVIFKEKENG